MPPANVSVRPGIGQGEWHAFPRRDLEERGFESVWAPEHSHIPLSRKTPFPGGGSNRWRSTRCRSTWRRGARPRFGSPAVLSRVHWVQPELVAEVKYLAWTEDDLLRQVVYEGLREDKPAIDVRRPAPHPKAGDVAKR